MEKRYKMQQIYVKKLGMWARIAKPSIINPKAGYCTRFDLYMYFSVIISSKIVEIM